MKKIILGMTLFISNVNSMDNLYHTPVISLDANSVNNKMNRDSIIPLTVKTQYETQLKQSFETSNAIVVVDYSVQQMNIKYKKASFTIPSTHNLYIIIDGIIRQTPLNKSKFSEKYERKGVVSLVEYSKVPALSYSVIYRAIEQYTN